MSPRPTRVASSFVRAPTRAMPVMRTAAPRRDRRRRETLTAGASPCTALGPRRHAHVAGPLDELAGMATGVIGSPDTREHARDLVDARVVEQQRCRRDRAAAHLVLGDEDVRVG